MTKIKEYRDKKGDYFKWKLGKYDMYILIEIDSFPSLDGTNLVIPTIKDDLTVHFQETKFTSGAFPYTVDEYIDIFCQKVNGRIYYPCKDL